MRLLGRFSQNLLIVLGSLSFLFLGYYVFNLPMPLDGQRYRELEAFEMVDQGGRPLTRNDLIGQPLVMLFGSTACDNICGTHLAVVSAVMRKLNASVSERLRFVFVGIDSERDNPRTMRAFLSAFDQRIIGLTGTKIQVRKMTRAYGPHFKKSPDGFGGYRVSHPTDVFLFNSGGDLVEVFGVSESSELENKLSALAEK